MSESPVPSGKRKYDPSNPAPRGKPIPRRANKASGTVLLPRLFLRKQLVDDLDNLVFSVAMTFYRRHKFSVLVSGDNPVACKLGFLDIFLALSFAYLDSRNRNLLSMLLVLVIHDDRNLAAEHSSIEIVIGQGRLLVISKGRGREAKRHQQNQQD